MAQLDVQQLLEKLSQAITYKYPGPCAPSVLVASLPNKSFYVSILKYGSTHQDKRVMYKAINADLCRALEDLMKQFLSSEGAGPNPVEELKTFAARHDAIKRQEQQAPFVHDPRIFTPGVNF